MHANGHEWLLRELLGNLAGQRHQIHPARWPRHLALRPRPAPGRQDGTPFLEVEDDGPGLAARKSVAACWSASTGCPARAGEGNGLGLAIADEIARVHRSHLQIAEGAGGRGLRVWLILRSGG